MPRPLRTLAAFGALGLIAAGLAIGGGISDARWLLMLFAAWVLLLIATRIRIPATVPVRARSTIRTALTLATVFAIVSVQLVRIQVVQSEATQTRTATAPNGDVVANPRLGNADLAVKRGRIYDRNGNVIADSKEVDGVWTREYPDPATAYVAGYYSPLLYGTAGLENTYNAELSGQQGNNPFLRLQNDLLHRPQQGLDLHLTLDANLQQSAMDMLNGRNGAVVVMDVKTGAVLALASNPNYDPNQLFTASPDQNAAAAAYWKQLNQDPDSPLVLRANLGLFTPGSTFKTITAGIAIDTNIANPDTVYTDDGEFTVDGHVIGGDNRPDTSQTQWTMRTSLGWSLNQVFAQIGLQIGPTLMWEYGQKYGIGATIPFDLPVSQGQLASSAGFLKSRPALADTAFGQGQIQVTPLYMAMIASMYANGGKMMKPYLVDSISTQDGKTVRTTSPGTWRQPVSAKTAGEVKSMMISAVDDGAIGRAQVGGYVVGGKTGTAETGATTAPHAWFIGFIGNPDPQYAVAVVLEHGGEGLAAPVTIGRDMLVAAIQATKPD